MKRGRHGTEDRLQPLAIRGDLSAKPIPVPLVFYQFNVQAAFITSLQGGSPPPPKKILPLPAEQVRVVFLSKREGRLVLDLQSHSALRASHCLAPLFVRCLPREKGPAKGVGRGAKLGSRRVPGVCTSPSTHYGHFSSKRLCNLMVVICTRVSSVETNTVKMLLLWCGGGGGVAGGHTFLYAAEIFKILTNCEHPGRNDNKREKKKNEQLCVIFFL